MTDKQLEKIKNALDERRGFALYTDEQMGNETGCFLENNPDYIYLKGMLDVVRILGVEYSIENGEFVLYD